MVLLAFATLVVSSLLSSCGLFGIDLGVDGLSVREVTIGDSDRSAIVVAPEAHHPDSPGSGELPLVVIMHGLAMTAEDMARTPGWPARVAEGGFMAVFPQGTDDSWDAGGCCGDAVTNNVDDVTFLDDVISQMVSEQGADADRVYVTGFSNGAMMTYLYACSRPDAIVGAASVAGTNFSDCEPTEAIPFLQVSGSEDPVIPVLGGTSSLPDIAEVPSVEESILAVARGAGCDAPTGAVEEHMTSFRATGCRNGAQVGYDVIDGLGHTYPTADESPQYVAVDEILEFWGLSVPG